ncbi:hypothetical protein ACU8DI_10875 [Psychroserpens sp. BH13MA-6]
MRQTLFVLFMLFFCSKTEAQFVKETFVDISVGYSICAPYDDVDTFGSGIYLQGEYVLKLTNWIDLRPYAGMILTNNESDNTDPNSPVYSVSANAFIIGGKTRLRVPIPWVAPYVEVGLGASIGSFENMTLFKNLNDSGVLIHVPASIGFELGPEHNFDIAFSYYFHDSVQLFAGAAAIGFSFPVGNNSK